MKAVEQLPLVLVNSLDLAVEERQRVHRHPVLLQQVLGKLGLVVLKIGASRTSKVDTFRATNIA